MTNPRTRIAAVAGSLALTMSLALAPAAMAQDGPLDTVQNFIDAVVAKDTEALPGFFCEAEAEQAAEFDVSAVEAEMPEGVDLQSLLDAFIFDFTVDTLELLSESEIEAIVSLAGTMSMEIDQDALVPIVEAVIEASGMEADEATVAMLLGIMASELEAESEEIETEITLEPGPDGGWLICSDLEFGGADLMGGGADEPDADAPAEDA